MEEKRLQELVNELSKSIEKMNKFNNRINDLEKKIADKEDGLIKEELVRLEEKLDETIKEYDKKQKEYQRRIYAESFDPESKKAMNEAAAAMAAKIQLVKSSDSNVKQKAFEYLDSYNKKMSDIHKKDLIPNTATGGIYVIPEPVARLVDGTVRNGAYLRPAATVMTARGQVVQIPVAGDVSVGWGQVELSEKSMTDANPSISRETLYIEELSAIGKFGFNELDDAEAAGEMLLQFFQGIMADKIVDTEEDGFATGRGHATYFEPNGIFNDAGITRIDSAAVGAISYEDFVELLHALKPQAMRNASFIMNNTTLGAVRKLKDDSGMPIWNPALNVATPMTILGKPVLLNASIDDVGASATPIACGDMRQYHIYDNRGLRFQILNELYSESNKVGLKVIKRTSGVVVVPEAFRLLNIKAA